MEKRSLCQREKCLVRTLDNEISAKMQCAVRENIRAEESQVSAVGFIDDERHAVSVADFGD